MLVVFTIKLATNVKMVVIFILTMLLDRQSKRPAAWALMVKEGPRVPFLLSTFIRWPHHHQSIIICITLYFSTAIDISTSCDLRRLDLYHFHFLQ